MLYLIRQICQIFQLKIFFALHAKIHCMLHQLYTEKLKRMTVKDCLTSFPSSCPYSYAFNLRYHTAHNNCHLQSGVTCNQGNYFVVKTITLLLQCRDVCPNTIASEITPSQTFTVVSTVRSGLTTSLYCVVDL